MTYFSDIKQTALNYTKMGLMCLPAKKDDKHPLTGWKRIPKIELGTTSNYFDKFKNCQPGIAIITGDRSNGLFVVDVDVKHMDGTEKLSEWQLEHGDFPKTWTAKSPSGGYHYYFKSDEAIGTREGLLGCIDIRGNGGLIIAPPTIRDGKAYEWLDGLSPKDIPLAKANESVLALANMKGRTERTSLPQNYNSDDLDFSEGHRHTAFNTLIGRLKKDGGLSDRDIEDMVRIKNSQIDDPLSDEELEKTVLGAIPRFDRKFKTKDETPKEVSLVSMADVQPKPIEWLIPGWIPKGKITLIGADGGTGKTFLWCHIVACLSAGKPCFFEDPIEFSSNPRKPMKFLVLSSEDELEEVLSERLISNGANMSNILSVPYTDPNFEYMKFNSETLKNTILEHRPDGCIFDPLQSFLPPNVNMGYRNQMRDALNPLVALGTETGTTMIIVMHTNKMSDRSGRGRFADSSDIFDIARSAFLLGKTKNGSLYLDHAKSNYAPLNKTVLYMLVDQVPKFLGSTEKKDWDFVHEKRLERSAPARDEAKQMILDLLEDQGEMNIKDLNTALKEAGISDKTIRNAKEDLNSTKKVKLYRKGLGKGKGVEWFISLPEEDKLL